MTQNEEIYQLLKVRPINSFERFNGGLYAGQLPRCINDLENKAPWNLKGNITHKRQKDGSVTYILRNIGGSDFSVPAISPSPSAGHYCFSGNAGAYLPYPENDCDRCGTRQEAWV